MLYWNTVSPLLRLALEDLMQQPAFNHFRLVGGTALSLHLGHRMSIDIDIFTDEPYGTINFQPLESYLSANYGYFYKSTHGLIGMGQSYLIGNNIDDNIKQDIYYTDPFIQPAHIEDGIRLATMEEVAAMKIDVVHRGGRKKDSGILMRSWKHTASMTCWLCRSSVTSGHTILKRFCNNW